MGFIYGIQNIFFQGNLPKTHSLTSWLRQQSSNLYQVPPLVLPPKLSAESASPSQPSAPPTLDIPKAGAPLRSATGTLERGWAHACTSQTAA